MGRSNLVLVTFLWSAVAVGCRHIDAPAGNAKDVIVDGRIQTPREFSLVGNVVVDNRYFRSQLPPDTNLSSVCMQVVDRERDGGVHREEILLAFSPCPQNGLSPTYNYLFDTPTLSGRRGEFFCGSKSCGEVGRPTDQHPWELKSLCTLSAINNCHIGVTRGVFNVFYPL